MIAFLSLLRAMEYIEQNIRAPFSPEDVASAAYLSVSHMNRLFSRVFHGSPANYILKRRLCVAAKELAETERPITDIALDAQFSAPESFSRAFKKQFLMTPSQYRREGVRFDNLYPPMTLRTDAEGGIAMTSAKAYDMSEVRERILSTKGTYVLLADLDHLLEINEKLGHAAGDAAIASVASRIARGITEGMIFFRTGGDEFTILTSSADLAACEETARRILSFSDEEVSYPGGTLKVSFSVGIAAIPQDIDDPQVAIDLADEALLRAKREGRGGYCVG